MPYVPSAKSPTASTPHAPQVPCTEIAPHGSSTPRRSKNATLATTSQPATPPMTMAAHGATNAQGAVMATRPASIPLHAIETSGLPYLRSVTIIAITNPTQLASNVFTATSPIRRSVAPSVEPGLNPIQPNTSTSEPMTTNGML